MPASLPRLALIHTGGTIASRPSPDGRGLTPQTPPALPGLEGVQVSEHQPFNLPSPHVTPAHMQQIAHLIEQLAGGHDAVVVTHGTDTLEETAFFLHLCLPAGLPLVLTGSMRHAEEVSWDGPGNLLDAAQVALCPQTAGRGPLVVFGGDIFDARTVTKVHTSAVDAFGGYPGPIGRIDRTAAGPQVHYFARPEPRPTFRPVTLERRVEILYAYAGWQGEGYTGALERADGLVIAALGTGNLPPELLPLIAATDKPVVLATRTHAGPILPVYGYAGGGATLVEAGAIPASFLNAHKARLLLLVLLNLGASREDIRRVFTQGVF